MENTDRREECSCLKLFKVFFKIGLFTIGGGMAMIPLMQDEMVSRKGWMTEDEFVDAVAVSQGLPGVIAINMATYTGYRKKKIAGAISATLGVVLPSFMIIIAIVELLGVAGDNRAVKGALMAIKAAATALIIWSALSVGRIAVKGVKEALVGLVSFVLIAVFHVNAIYVIIMGIIMGIVESCLRKKSEKK